MENHSATKYQGYAFLGETWVLVQIVRYSVDAWFPSHRLALVISPLIALMKDQVDVLRARGVKASSLDSTLTAEESRAVKGALGDISM